MKTKTLSLAELAEIWDVTKRWINRLSKEKGLPRKSPGRYDLKETTRWLKNYYESQIKDPKNSAKIQHSEERTAQYRADKLEIELRVLQRTYIPVDEAVQKIENLFAAIRQNLLGIPKHAARELGNKEIEEYLEKFIYRSCEEISNIGFRLFPADGLRNEAEILAPRVDEAPAKAHRKRVGRQVPAVKPRGKRRERPVANVEGGVSTGDDGRDKRPPV